MRQLYILSFLALLLSSCSGLMKQGDEIDLMDYHYAVDSLREAKVLVYVDDSTGEHSYSQQSVMIAGRDTSMVLIGYDSACHGRFYTRTQVTRDKLILREASYYVAGSGERIPMLLKRTTNDRVQMLGRAGFVLEKVRERRDSLSKMKMRVTNTLTRGDSSIYRSFYKGADVLMVATLSEWTPLYPERDKKRSRFTDTSYIARGVGLIYYEKVTKARVKRFRLERVISVPEFERICGERQSNSLKTKQPL